MSTETAPNSGDEVAAVIESQLIELDALAEQAEWQRVEAVLKRLPQLTLRVPLSSRREVILRTQARVERLRGKVLSQSEDVNLRLSGLKTGQRAVARYRETGAISNR